jgi:hypothetical protein
LDHGVVDTLGSVGEKSADRGSAASLVLLRIRKVTIAGVATLPSPTRTDAARTFHWTCSRL